MYKINFSDTVNGTLYMIIKLSILSLSMHFRMDGKYNIVFRFKLINLVFQ